MFVDFHILLCYCKLKFEVDYCKFLLIPCVDFRVESTFLHFASIVLFLLSSPFLLNKAVFHKVLNFCGKLPCFLMTNFANNKKLLYAQIASHSSQLPCLEFTCRESFCAAETGSPRRESFCAAETGSAPRRQRPARRRAEKRPEIVF